MRILFLSAFITILMGMTGAHAQDNNYKKALLAGGCFWCIESDFAKKDGVIDVFSGYAGGERPEPTYDDYYKTTDAYPTPHLEVIEVTYDPEILTFRDVVQYHFENIDPTDGEGQFGDRGPQYRPAVFYDTHEEKQIIEEISAATETKIQKEVKVDILPMATFWPAEEFHQDYAKKNPARYKFFRWNSGRDSTIDKVWNRE
jgi:peptide methionine sulfoxide reductase msrA/msrB